VLNIVGVVKLVLGKKVWATWELDFGHKPEVKARYFTQDELQRIINNATGHIACCLLCWPELECESGKRQVCTLRMLKWTTAESSFAKLYGTEWSSHRRQRSASD
jgi:hypothetical protein